MKEEYWEQFMTTGRIADYLSYKAESEKQRKSLFGRTEGTGRS